MGGAQAGGDLRLPWSDYGLTAKELRAHRKEDRFKPVAAFLLTKLGGLTQREVATLLGLRTGAAVCLQLKHLKEASSAGKKEDVGKLEKQIQAAMADPNGPVSNLEVESPVAARPSMKNDSTL